MVEPSAIALEQFADVGAAATQFELKVRLFANNHNLPFLGGLEAVLKLILTKCNNELSVEESQKLRLAHRLRNKLLHIEFDRVQKKLVSLQTEISRGKVYMINLDEGLCRKVSDCSTNDGTIYGWLMEAYLSGTLVETQKIIIEAINILDSLRDKIIGN